jgi:hypothetical protein
MGRVGKLALRFIECDRCIYVYALQTSHLFNFLALYFMTFLCREG